MVPVNKMCRLPVSTRQPPCDDSYDGHGGELRTLMMVSQVSLESLIKARKRREAVLDERFDAVHEMLMERSCGCGRRG